MKWTLLSVLLLNGAATAFAGLAQSSLASARNVTHHAQHLTAPTSRELLLGAGFTAGVFGTAALAKKIHKSLREQSASKEQQKMEADTFKRVKELLSEVYDLDDPQYDQEGDSLDRRTNIMEKVEQLLISLPTFGPKIRYDQFTPFEMDHLGATSFYSGLNGIMDLRRWHNSQARIWASEVKRGINTEESGRLLAKNQAIVAELDKQFAQLRRRFRGYFLVDQLPLFRGSEGRMKYYFETMTWVEHDALRDSVDWKNLSV